ncbi:MAG TPA: signal peptidase II [Longimicrobiales bacterium]|nr:signal peptidase II [Longimicrobiales bacterium]
MRGKLIIAAGIIPAVLLVDRLTKWWAEAVLPGNPQEILGGLLPLTLAYNTGAAFGLSVGEDSRWLFIPVTFVALVLLVLLLRQAEDDDRLRHVSLSLVLAGALGNLYDRIFYPRGVVDFFGPVDLGFWHFPIFNVADISITCGAILLAVSFWQEERREKAREALKASAPPGPEPLPDADPTLGEPADAGAPESREIPAVDPTS